MEKLTARALLLLAVCFSASDAATYVGSRQCFACHEKIYRSFLETDMGRSMRVAQDLMPGTIPREATVSVPSGNRVLKVTHDANGWQQSESEPGIFTDEHRLEYAVGSGANGMSFIVKRGNSLFQAPLSFYSRTKEWNLSPGYQLADLGFSRPIAQECVACHSGRARPVARHNGEYMDPPFEELAIGCENCHGPGSVHAGHPGQPGAIANPAKLTARLAEEICINCHQGGDARILQPGKTNEDFRPGSWSLETAALFKIPANLRENKEADLLEHHSAMKASKCFRASGGKLSCLTCHDPHTQPGGKQAEVYYRSKCLTCHTDASCPVPLPARVKQAGSDNCIACHMPKRQVAVISHSALTNHRIPARPDEKTPLQEQPDGNTDLILVNEPAEPKVQLPAITLLKGYAELAGQNALYKQHYLTLLAVLSQKQPQDPYLQAALGHKALDEGKNDEAIQHLSLGIALGETSTYMDMATALTNAGRLPDAVKYLETAVQQDPYDAVRRKTLTLDYIKLQRYSEATEQLQKYVEIFPEDSFMRGLLAKVMQ